MRRLLLIMFVFGFAVPSWGQKKVIIPFFGKMKMTDLCGTGNCRPSYGVKAYVRKSDKLYYDENYNSILGRKFSGKYIFDNHSSGLRKITDKDVNLLFKTEGVATLDGGQKKHFDAKLTADLKQILETEIQLPADLKAQLFIKSWAITFKQKQKAL